MACFHPKYAIKRKVYLIDEKTGEVKRSNKLTFKSVFPGEELKENITAVPCGKCAGCIIDKASDFATRAALEYKFWKKGVFVTLTYDPKHLPKNRELNKPDLINFWKRLRKKNKGFKSWYYKGQLQTPIRYMSCGEYGEKKGRPHYHALIFNWMPSDMKPYKKNKYGDWLYTSKELQNIWGMGKVIIGIASYESASYVARYTQKKIFKKNKWEKDRPKEFIENSRRGGIGITIFQQPEELQKMKDNKCILIPTAKGVRFRKIPSYIREKWKDYDREEYFNTMDEHSEQMKKKIREEIKKTGLEIGSYLAIQEEIFMKRMERCKRDIYDED